MIANSISSTETVRNVFVIDDKGIVRTVLVYPMNVGRCVPEILRIIEALQTADCNNASTPANWIPDDPIIVPTPTTYMQLKERNNEISENKNGMNWYLSFKQPECSIKKFESRDVDVKKIESKNIEKK